MPVREDGLVSSAPIQPTGRPAPRMRQTVRDMVISMGVVLAIVGVFVAAAWRPTPDPIRLVDPAPVVAAAATTADFPVQAPSGLSSDWRPTSARWQPTTASGAVPVLHIGYVTPAGQYAQVTQARMDYAPYLAEQTGHGVAEGSQQIGDANWVRMTGDNGDRSLVLTADGVTTIVFGSADWDELTTLAAALRPVT